MLLIALLIIALFISCKNQAKLKLQEIEQQYSQEYRQKLEKIEDKGYLVELLNDDELVYLLNDVFTWKEEWFYKLTDLEFSNDELKLIIKTVESFSGNDQYRLKYLEYITTEDSDTYLSSLTLKEQSELFKKLYEIGYPVENIPSLFTNIKQSLQYNDEEAKIALLSDPFLVSSEEFLPFYKTYAGSESEKELIDFIDSIEDISYLDKFDLFKKFRNSNVLEIVDEIKSQDNQTYEDILGINILGFFNIYNFLKIEDMKEFITYLKEVKSIDLELYESYIKYNPESFYALQEISKYYGEDRTIEYRPTPDSVLELYNIILGIPEEYRLDYIENSFKSAYAVIINGHEETGFESISLYIKILKELNIPYFIISNNYNFSNKPACSILDTVPINENFDIYYDDIKKINDSLSGKYVSGVKTDIKTKNEFINTLKEIIKEDDSEILNIFLMAHGSGYDLYFGSDPVSEVQNYHYDIYPNDLINIFNDLSGDNKLFLQSCHSNKFANYFKGTSDIKIVSSSDFIAPGDDLPYSILISMKSNDYRIEMEELMNISDEVNPYCEGGNGNHYIVDDFDYEIIGDKDMLVNGEPCEFDIKFTNFKDETSILYYHVESLNNIEISNISPCKSSLIEEEKDDIFNSLNSIIPFIDDIKIEKFEFPILFDDIENGAETYEWYLNNLDGFITTSGYTWTYNDATTAIEQFGGTEFCAINDEYIIGFCFSKNAMEIYLNPVNCNFLNNLDFYDIQGFIESIIPLPRGNMNQHWIPTLKIYGFLPEEFSNTHSYFKKTLLEKNITIDYEANDNGYSSLHYNKDGLDVSIRLFAICDNLTDIEITIFKPPN